MPACRLSGLSFIQDKRVEITSPKPFTPVDLPVTVDWTAHDIDPGVHFGVFLDSTPPAPSKDLESLAKDDKTCRPEAGCPDEKWFRQHGVYETDDTSFTFKFIGDLRAPDSTQPDQHEVTVVYLDENGVRVSESAFGVEFYVNHGGE